MRTSALIGAKNSEFFKMYGVSGVSAWARGGGGLGQFGHFADKGKEGQCFAILCGRLLWTVPKTGMLVIAGLILGQIKIF